MSRAISPEGLNRERDEYVRHARALVYRFGEHSPTDVQGILGRAAEVLRAQFAALDELGALDFETPPRDPLPFELALTRAQHLPRMVRAFSSVEQQQEREQTLLPLAEAAHTLADRLARLTQRWVLAHMDPAELAELLRAEAARLQGLEPPPPPPEAGGKKNTP